MGFQFCRQACQFQRGPTVFQCFPQVPMASLCCQPALQVFQFCQVCQREPTASLTLAVFQVYQFSQQVPTDFQFSRQAPMVFQFSRQAPMVFQFCQQA